MYWKIEVKIEEVIGLGDVTMVKNKCRNSNIEILRIIAMLFIVVSHYCSHNGITAYSLPIGANRFLLNILVLGNIGVILFILISGYFLIDYDKFSLKKLLKLVLEVWFYSAIIYVICCLSGLTKLSIRELALNFIPITSKRYWFATCYVVLYIFHPFINRFLKSLSKKEYQLFLIISLILFSFIPTFLTSTANFYGNDLIQFLLFYSIGAYIRKYDLDFLTKKKNVYLLMASSVTLILSVIVINLLSMKIPSLGMYANQFYERHSIVAIIFSVSLFKFFIFCKPFYNRFINTISATMFGVYLIHDNNYIRYLLWHDIAHSGEYVLSNWLLLHVVLCVSLVFIVCIIIELTRKNLIEKPLFNKFDKTIDNIQIKIAKKLKLESNFI